MRWFARRIPGLPFADRRAAGERLAARLAELLGSDELLGQRETAGAPGIDGAPGVVGAAGGVGRRETVGAVDPARPAIVLGIPRGGVPVAAAVAGCLGLPLDVVVAHKLGTPGQPELALGAVAADGTVVVEPWARDVVADDDYVRSVAEAELARVRAHEAVLRRGRPATDLRGRAAIVVDDGIATGATIRAAALAVRSAGASRVILASPVGATESVAALRAVADEVVVVATPDPFYAVGEFYERFDQVGDDEVAALLERGGSGP